MAKKDKNKKQNLGQSGKPNNGNTNGGNTHSNQEKWKDIKDKALVHATPEDLESVKSMTAVDLTMTEKEMIDEAVKTLALLELQSKRLGEKERALDKSIENNKDDRNIIGTEKQRLEKENQELKSQQKAMGEQERSLNERHEVILKREADADSGFIKRNGESLASLESEYVEIKESIRTHRSRVEKERADWDQELETRKKKLEEDCEKKRNELEVELLTRRKNFDSKCEKVRDAILSEKEKMDMERKTLRKERDDYQLDCEMLEEDKKSFDEKVSRRATREIETKDGEIRELNERLAAARERMDQLAGQVMEHEEANRLFGHQTPAGVRKILADTERERDKLRKEIDDLPSREQAQRLTELEREKEQWTQERLQLMDEVAQLKQNAARYRIAVTEMETLRDEKLSLTSGNDLLREANQQLRSEIDGLIKASDNKTPFPACIQMDKNGELQSTEKTLEKISDLSELTKYVRSRIRVDKNLFYSLEDVRCFIGGLAMSRLHLLQGISGTGKTSLPLAFAKAIGAGDAVIEVQAGWRDRQDLIGHYNSFEKKFYELEFLQALYKAQCPKYRDTPYIVVLDEMNLSHPEQYFADLLSALEQEPGRQRLMLMQSSCEQAPTLMAEGGKYLKIPQNVWFVGTANHDETTKDFADKTYDRAHVMELPRHHEEFSMDNVKPKDPISMAALQNAFESAKERYGEEAGKAYRFLEGALGDMLEKKFNVGWGNRLQRQMDDYVPVVMACGGSVGEAVDHILATKILRKIRDRYDNREEHLLALRDRINDRWKTLDGTSKPKRALGICGMELARLGHSEE